MVKLCLAWIAVMMLGVGCVEMDDAELGTHEGALEPVLCVLTLDCGGFCGTDKEIRAFLNQCSAQTRSSELVGPCFSQCWNPCLHKASNSQNPNPTLCTLECMNAQCPASAAETGLIQAGRSDACPAPAPDVICPLYFSPVTCGAGDCSYSNTCFASAAGFGPGQCTSSAF